MAVACGPLRGQGVESQPSFSKCRVPPPVPGTVGLPRPPRPRASSASAVRVREGPCPTLSVGLGPSPKARPFCCAERGAARRCGVIRCESRRGGERGEAEARSSRSQQSTVARSPFRPSVPAPW